MPEKIEESAPRRISREVGDPGLFPPEVLRLYELGQARKAQAALRAALAKEPNSARKRRQEQYVADPYLWLEPIEKAPSLHTINGIGTTLYGHHKPNPDGVHVAVLWFVVVFLPVFPLAAYVVRKGDGNLWHFYAKAPLPPYARVWRLAFAALAIVGALAAAGTWGFTAHTTRVSIYNGFDVPLQVTLGEDAFPVAPHALVDAGRRARDASLRVTATPEGWVQPLETLDVVPGSVDGRRLLYNPAGRAALVKSWIVYGTGEPPDDELLGAPVFSGLSGFDYVFTDPPQTKEVEVGKIVTNTVLSDLDTQLPFPVSTLIVESTSGPEHAWRMVAAHLAVHPADVQTAAIAVRHHPLGSPGLAAVGALARAGRPDDVEAHRLFQNLAAAGQREAIAAEYEALAAEHPDAAMYQYLASRVQADGSTEAESFLRRALEIDPGYAYAHLGLGFQFATRGRLDEALTEYAAWAASGDEALGIALRSRVRLLQARGAPGWREEAIALVDDASGRLGSSYALATLRGGLRASGGALEAALAELPEALGPAPEAEDAAAALLSARLEVTLAAGDRAAVRSLLAETDPERDRIQRTRAELFLALAEEDRETLRRLLDERQEDITAIGPFFALQAAAAAQALGHPSATTLAGTADPSAAGGTDPSVVLGADADLSTPATLDALLAPVGLESRGYGYAAAATLIALGGRGDAAALSHARAEAARLLLPDEHPR